MRLGLTLLATVAPTALAAQSTIHVPGDAPTIQAGIESALDGDTVLVAPGTYVEQIDLLGKAITVRSEAGPAATVIDSQGQFFWPDGPNGVVRMIRGEGRSTVLEGFTITGGASVGGSYNGIYCSGLSPTIRDCVITNNHSGSFGGGVWGDPLLERCTISDNSSDPVGAPGGGLYGAPTMIDCIVTGNRSGDRGGGLYASGPCRIVRTVFDSNIAGNGADGYEGGGVFGPATLIDCRITRNSAHHYITSRGAEYEIGTGVEEAVLLKGCTVADNFSADGPWPGLTAGVRDVAVIEDSIVWNNQGEQLSDESLALVSYSIVQGGYHGGGNLDADPLFLDAAAGDYFLQPGSPAIDAANPASEPDPDGTPADLGALWFPQFRAASEALGGTGVNPVCFTSATLPVIGSTWIGEVDATAHGFAADSVILVGYTDAMPPLSLPFGELVVDPSSTLVLLEAAVPQGGVAEFPIPVPEDYSLGGFEVNAQAMVVGTEPGLCNGLRLVLGL